MVEKAEMERENGHPTIKVFENPYFLPPHVSKISEAILLAVLSHVVVSSNPPIDEGHFDQVVQDLLFAEHGFS